MNNKVYVFLTGLTILILSVSCQKEDESSTCSGFTVNVSNWTNSRNAIAEANNGAEPITYEWGNGERGAIIGGVMGSLQNGTYTVTARDNRGCKAQASITISGASNEEIVFSSEVTCVRENSAYMTMGIYDGDGDYYDNPDIPIIEKGICYGQSPSPTLSDNITQKIIWGEYELAPLQMASNYYARAYALTTKDTVYGEEHSFSTNSSPPPFTIGQNYQGGIISDIECDGQHGTIVLARNLNANGFPVGHDDAEFRCENLNESGFSDWVLPTYKDLYYIDKNLHEKGIGNLHAGSTIHDSYWARFKEYNNDECFSFIARYRNFQQDSTGEACTFTHLYVRPVRYF